MKNFLAILFTSSLALAQSQIPNNTLKLGQKNSTNKDIIFDVDNGAANPRLRANGTTKRLQFTNDGSVYRDIGSGSGSGGNGINLLSNGGFETGITDGWTSSGGTFAEVTSGTNLLYQEKSASFVTTATGQYFESTAIAIPEILKGQNCYVKISYKGADSNGYLTVFDSTTEIIPSAARAILNSTAGTKEAKTYFTCPSTGSLKLRVSSTAAMSIGYFDQAVLGQADFLPVKQSQYLGGIKYTGVAGCSWTTTSTSFVNHSVNASCNTATASGQAVPPPTKVPAITLPFAQKGTYYFIATGRIQKSGAVDGAAYYRFSDGTNFSGSTGMRNNTSFSGGGTVVGTVNLPSDTSNWTVNLQGAIDGAGGTATLIENVAGSPLTDFIIEVYFYPSGSDTVVNSKCLNAIQCENDFIAQVSNTGVVSGEDLDWINGNCTGSGSFTCTFNSGIFTVAPQCQTTLNQGFNTTGGTTLTALSTGSVSYNTVSNGAISGLAATLRCKKVGVDFKPKQDITGFFANTMTSSISSPRFVAGLVTTVCTTSPCTILYQTGDISSITRTSTGQYIVNWQTGTWTGNYYCDVNSFGTGSISLDQTGYNPGTFSFITRNSSNGVFNDAGFKVSCIGQK